MRLHECGYVAAVAAGRDLAIIRRPDAATTRPCAAVPANRHRRNAACAGLRRNGAGAFDKLRGL